MLLPEPRFDQTPVQRATRPTMVPPALLKSPPTITSPLRSTWIARTGPFVPVLRLVQPLPFASQRAMLFTVTPPAVVNEPPTRTSPFASRASA